MQRQRQSTQKLTLNRYFWLCVGFASKNSSRQCTRTDATMCEVLPCCCAVYHVHTFTWIYDEFVSMLMTFRNDGFDWISLAPHFVWPFLYVPLLFFINYQISDVIRRPKDAFYNECSMKYWKNIELRILFLFAEHREQRRLYHIALPIACICEWRHPCNILKQ